MTCSVNALGGLPGRPWADLLVARPGSCAQLVSALVGCLPSEAARLHGEPAPPPELALLATALVAQFVGAVTPTGGAPEIWAAVVGVEYLDTVRSGAPAAAKPATLRSADACLGSIADALKQYRLLHGLVSGAPTEQPAVLQLTPATVA